MDKRLNELRSKIPQTLLSYAEPNQPINYRGPTIITVEHEISFNAPINQLNMNLKQHSNNPHVITTLASSREQSQSWLAL